MQVHGMLRMYPREIRSLLLRLLREFDDLVAEDQLQRPSQVLTVRHDR